VHEFKELLLCDAALAQGNVPCPEEEWIHYTGEAMKTKTNIHCGICNGIVYIIPEHPRSAVLDESEAGQARRPESEE